MAEIVPQEGDADHQGGGIDEKLVNIFATAEFDEALIIPKHAQPEKKKDIDAEKEVDGLPGKRVIDKALLFHGGNI